VISKGRTKEVFREYKTLDPPTDNNIPLMVLVNEHSASASEIVCGAIQDLDRGIVIGRNTFGKGLVQNVRPLVYRTQMKVTIAKYYIPSGRCIQLLDYSHKNADGKAIAIPDSLRKKFKTKHGREVLDGGGVRPDIIVPFEKVPNIVQGLEKSYIIFDFANAYRNTHESIAEIKSFEVDDALFAEFKSYVSNKTFTSLNPSEQALLELKNKLKEQTFTDATINEFNAMEKAIQKAKSAEMDTYKSEIKKILKTEICRRYYYEDAVYLTGFYQDNDILKSIETFANSSKFNQILGK
jgi:carboxyl-terminal processing protease